MVCLLRAANESLPEPRRRSVNGVRMLREFAQNGVHGVSPATSAFEGFCLSHNLAEICTEQGLVPRV